MADEWDQFQAVAEPAENWDQFQAVPTEPASSDSGWDQFKSVATVAAPTGTESWTGTPSELDALSQMPKPIIASPVGRGAERALESVIPTSLGGVGRMAGEMAAGLVVPITGEDIQTVKNVGKVIQGAPIEETFQEKPFNQYDLEDWVAFGGTVGLQGLMAVPLFRGLRPEVKAEIVSKVEPPPIVRVSPETGEVFHVDLKTGEVIQPDEIAPQAKPLQPEPAAATELPITQEQYGQEVRQEPAITGTAESGGSGQQPTSLEADLGVASPETQSPRATVGGEVGISQDRKPSKIGQSIEAKAVEAKLTRGFSETAGYDPITIKDQARRADNLVKTFPTRARAIIRGEAPLPEGLRGTPLITALEEHLANNPDPQLAYELANSPLTSATSAAAQEMRLMAERVPDSITSKFEEIKRARVEGARLRGETPETIARDITNEVVKNGSKRPTWEQFVNEIAC